MLSVFKPTVEKGLRPIARPLHKVNPNVITAFGMVFPVFFYLLVVHGAYGWALLMLVLTATDMLDGIVARTQNKVTAFGGFFDSTVDRFADFMVLVAFGYAGITSWGLTLTLILLSYLISFIRSRTEVAGKGKIVASVGIIERTERLLIIFIGLALYAIWPAATIAGYNVMTITFFTLIVLSTITVAQRFAFAYQKLK